MNKSAQQEIMADYALKKGSTHLEAKSP